MYIWVNRYVLVHEAFQKVMCKISLYMSDVDIYVRVIWYSLVIQGYHFVGLLHVIFL